MLDYSLWQDRLVSRIGNNVKSIGFADSIKSVLANAVKATPSLHVIPKDERGTNLHTTGRNGSLITAGVDVVIIARDNSDAVGGQVTKNIKAIADMVDSALMGWTPSDANQPIFFRSSKRIAMYKGLLIWAQTYDTKYLKV